MKRLLFVPALLLAHSVCYGQVKHISHYQGNVTARIDNHNNITIINDHAKGKAKTFVGVAQIPALQLPTIELQARYSAEKVVSGKWQLLSVFDKLDDLQKYRLQNLANREKSTIYVFRKDTDERILTFSKK